MCRRREAISNDYFLDSIVILRVSVVRDLGVYFDSHLSFSHHVCQMVGSTIRLLGMISRLTREFLNPICIIRLFSSLIRSRLEFASVVWNSITMTYALQIENVQKRFIRIVYDRYFQRRCYYDYAYILGNLGLQKLSSRRTARDLLLMHKIIHGQIDSSLVCSFNFHVPVLSANTHACFILIHRRSSVRPPVCSSVLMTFH